MGLPVGFSGFGYPTTSLYWSDNFSQNGPPLLNSHIVDIHNGLKKHKCDKCDKIFSRPNMKSHMTSIHGIIDIVENKTKKKQTIKSNKKVKKFKGRVKINIDGK